MINTYLHVHFSVKEVGANHGMSGKGEKVSKSDRGRPNRPTQTFKSIGVKDQKVEKMMI